VSGTVTFSPPDLLQKALLGFAMACLPAISQIARGGEPVDIADRNQIFIDGRYIEKGKSVRIVVQRPRKTGERNLVSGIYRAVPEHPLELRDGPDLWVYAQILENDGTFRGFGFVSEDGIKWQVATEALLEAGNFAYGLRTGSGTVFTDPRAPASQRYKIVSGLPDEVLASADGREWQVIHKGVFPGEFSFPRGMDSQNVAFYEESLDKYVAFVRVNKWVKPPPRHEAYFAKSLFHQGHNHLRCVGRLTSDDLRRFEDPQIVLAPDEQDPTMDGVPVADFYMPQVLRYPHAQDAYVMFPNRYLHYQDWFIADDLSGFHTGRGTDVLNVGPIDIGFAASRDGIQWEQFDREPLIPLGLTGEFDDRGLYPVRGLVVHGDEMWLYYLGAPEHYLPEDGHEFRIVMSRVVFRRDGFTAVEAEYSGGEFTTPVLRFSGNALNLNIETSALGLARVEIQDDTGKPIPGFSLDECDRIHTANSVNRIVKWRKGTTDISSLAGQPVRFRFELKFGAKLYAFRTAASSG